MSYLAVRDDSDTSTCMSLDPSVCSEPTEPKRKSLSVSLLMMGWIHSTVKFLIWHTVHPQVSVCISRLYAWIDRSHGCYGEWHLLQMWLRGCSILRPEPIQCCLHLPIVLLHSGMDTKLPHLHLRHQHVHTWNIGVLQTQHLQLCTQLHPLCRGYLWQYQLLLVL